MSQKQHTTQQSSSTLSSHNPEPKENPSLFREDIIDITATITAEYDQKRKYKVKHNSPNQQLQHLNLNDALNYLDLLKAAVIMFTINKNHGDSNITMLYASPNIYAGLSPQTNQTLDTHHSINNTKKEYEENIDILQQTCALHINAEDLTSVILPAFDAIRTTQQKQHIRFRYNAPIGSLWLEAHLIPSPNQDQNSFEIFAMLQDITHYKTESTKQSQSDAITHLNNRKAFTQYITDALHSLKTNTLSSAAIIILNINNFKHINNNLSYKGGDTLLKQVSDRLQLSFTPEVVLSRFGVDEFGLLIKNYTQVSQLESTAQLLMDILSEPFDINNFAIHVTASIGICILDTNDTSAEIAIGNAGIASQKAKQYRTGGYMIFDNSMHEQNYSEFLMYGALRDALTQNHVELYYMPQYSLHNKTISGCEALLRWHDPERGIIPPNAFIPLAEKTGMIVDIDFWVIKNACLTLKQWSESGINLPLSINLSSQFFNEYNAVDIISQALAENKISPHLLEIEITESTIMKNFARSINQLEQLQQRGIRIALDDFGTGYSSLAYLKNFSINAIKIDKSFIDDIVYESNSQAIVKSIINLAQALKLSTIAEGVETIEQLEYLTQIKCDIIQGYLISKPVCMSDLIALHTNPDIILFNTRNDSPNLLRRLY